MEVKYELMPSGLYIYLKGELDDCTSEKARERIDSIIEKCGNVRAVIFNLKYLSFMDSTGIGMIIGRYKKLKQNKIAVYIENPSFCADKVFQTSGIYSLIPKI